LANNDFAKSESCIGCAERRSASIANDAPPVVGASYVKQVLNREIIFDQSLSTTGQRQIIGQRGVQTAAKYCSAFMAAIPRFKARYLTFNLKK
jgi:hypothetical protein